MVFELVYDHAVQVQYGIAVTRHHLGEGLPAYLPAHGLREGVRAAGIIRFCPGVIPHSVGRLLRIIRPGVPRGSGLYAGFGQVRVIGQAGQTALRSVAALDRVRAGPGVGHGAGVIGHSRVRVLAGRLSGPGLLAGAGVHPGIIDILQRLFDVTLQVCRLLFLKDRCHGLESHTEVDVLTVGDATLDAAAVVGDGCGTTVNRTKNIVLF